MLLLFRYASRLATLRQIIARPDTLRHVAIAKAIFRYAQGCCHIRHKRRALRSAVMLAMPLMVSYYSGAHAY